MIRLFHRVTKQAASAPGTISFSGEKKVEDVTASVLDYGADLFEERVLETAEACIPYRETPSCSWINVNGLHRTDFLKSIGDSFGLHALVLEDIANTHQRPKIEDYGDFVYIVCRMLSLEESGAHLKSEQVSLVIGRNFVLTFQEQPGDVFEPVRERLRIGKGRIRRGGPGYLGYALLDAVVDQYFYVLETFGDQIESLEESLLDDPTIETLQAVHGLKREMVMLRRAVRPLRDVLSTMEREETPLIGEEILPFLRDVYDHVIQVSDSVDTFRDVLSGLQDLYMSTVSNRMNEVMKVLTIFASIFVPLTFVAGIYGMNFAHMPELGWRWSYPVFWGVIVVLVMAMVIYFRRKRWF